MFFSGTSYDQATFPRKPIYNMPVFTWLKACSVMQFEQLG